MAGLKDDSILQKMYEKEDLLTQPLDNVIFLAKTLEGARHSVMATREATTEWQGKVCHLQGRKYVKGGNLTINVTRPDKGLSVFNAEKKDTTNGNVRRRR